MELLLKCIVGSQAYSTNTPESDIDIKGIYQQSNRKLLGYGYRPQYEVGKDEVYFEIKRFLDLLETANPTILELLFSPDDCIISKHSKLDSLFLNKYSFLTQKCKMSFGGYAVQQIKKAKGLEKKQNWEKDKIEKKEPIDFCYVVIDKQTKISNVKQGVYPLKDWLRKQKINHENVYLNKLNHTAEGYQLYYGKGGIMTKDNNRLKTISSPIIAEPIATILYNENAFTQHKRDYESYQIWLKERNTSRYVDFKTHGQSYDGKNLLHCRRLLDMAIEIAKEGNLIVRRPNKEYLLSIRRGEVDLGDIIKKAEEDLLLLDELYKNSSLPDKVNQFLIEDILLEIREV